MKSDETRGRSDTERVLSTLAFSRFDRLLLLVMTTKAPSPHDWSTWGQAYANAALEHDVRFLLVVSEGGGPNAAQRKQVIETMLQALGVDEADTFRTAICSDAPGARFITAALGWLYAISNMKHFAPDGQAEALQYLGLEEERHAPILAAVPRIRQALRARQ